MSNIHSLLLAAGESSRMESPKQLLPWAGKTLIEHQLSTLLKTGSQLTVILGAHSEKIVKVIESYPVNTFVHNEWKNGMGSSISYGISKIIGDDPNIDAVLITLVDQPLLTNTFYNIMMRDFEANKKQILLSRSEGGTSSPPVLFDKIYFKELQNLIGDEGAKHVVKNHSKFVNYIDGGRLLRDIDTPEDYRELLRYHDT